MLIKKHLSSCQKRKNKMRVDKLIKSDEGSMDKFVFKKDSATNSEQLYITNVEEQPDHTENVVEDNHTENFSDHENLGNADEQASSFDIYDPRTWDILDNKSRDILIEKGPIREFNLEFPEDEIGGRHFSYDYYSRKLRNGEFSDRRWLAYSKHVNKFYCFCCKLFKSGKSRSLLASEGLKDSRHLSEKLKLHENSVEHINNMNTWNEVRLRLSTKEIIDKDLLQEIAREKGRWRLVLIRIVAAVKFLAKHSLAFEDQMRNYIKITMEIFWE
ncbi:hypothetical protein ZWY2020_041412 [Hordeum vulgare]|nr:hypothetical protein ZWY2020_041412 [Hordeum vulgare]